MVHTRAVPLAPTGNKESTYRRLFVIDIENIVGGAHNVTDEGAKWARSVLEAELKMIDSEHAIIAVSATQGLFPASLAFPGKSLKVRFGSSGADLALINAVDVRHTACRYDEVVIASGDGIFAQLAAHLAGSGTRVTAVGHQRGMSAALRLAVHETKFFGTKYQHSWRYA